MKVQAMIDIETLSTQHNSWILSVGAVKFKKKIYDEFYYVVDPDDDDIKKFDINIYTVLWWLRQKHDSIIDITNKKDMADLEYILTTLGHFLDDVDLVWCNGVSFDFPILEHAYKVKKIKSPLDFRKMMDYRTLKNMYPEKLSAVKNDHVAVADAANQAENLINILEHIKWN